MKVTSDYHVHTKLSSCAHEDALPEGYIDLARKLGIKTIGFSDHLWDSAVPGASPWYQPQNIEHVMEILDLLPEQDDVNILIGCETEMDKNDVIGLSEEGSANFDFVLVPISHFHMRGFTIPEEMHDLADIRKRLLERFYKVADTGFVSGYAHPFVTLGYTDVEQELLSGFTDGEYADCFKAAAQSKKSIEINRHVFSNRLEKQENGFAYEYQRMFVIAREQGCSFHFGSDAHEYKTFADNAAAGEFASACGITKDMIIPLEDLA